MSPLDLFLTHDNGVAILAKRLHSQEASRRGIEVEDLQQVGLLALWQSAQRFDASLGLKFATCAWKRVRGAMLDLIRQARSREAKSQRRLHIPISLEASGIVAWSREADVWTRLIAAEEREELHRRMARLPEYLADAVCSELEGESTTVSAARHGIAQNSALWRRREGVRRLQGVA